MTEVRTSPVPAVFVSYEEFFDENMMARVPGSIAVTEQENGSIWIYGCPCGCGASGRLRVSAGTKPTEKPSWLWNGSTDAPTLQPSVYHVGHWHGYLGGASGQSPGVWVSV